MKKILIFALLVLPMASFGASSVRVLGSGTATPATGIAGAAKVTPAKVTAAKPAATSTAATSRIGTIRVKPKATTTTLSTGTSSSTSTGSRFPVITPAQSYKTVNTQQAGATNTGTGTGTAQPASVTDDPRFDMIHVESRENYWRTNYPALTNQRVDEGYVFMWVEE